MKQLPNATWRIRGDLFDAGLDALPETPQPGPGRTGHAAGDRNQGQDRELGPAAGELA